MPTPDVENLPIPVSPTTPELEERRVKALELQAATLKQIANMQAEAGAPLLGDPKMQRFERILGHCLVGRVATDVEGFLKFTRELCDGIDREFPPVSPP